jgi:hypothetical protein
MQKCTILERQALGVTVYDELSDTAKKLLLNPQKTF